MDSRTIITTCVSPNVNGRYSAGDIFMIQWIMARFPNSDALAIMKNLEAEGYVEYKEEEGRFSGYYLTTAGAALANS